ncbi:MAG: carbon-nitrogen hydrolase family protein [Oscillospiraceae bacterium]|nr:carbon-nitrogen hydrolase family protein [Oscillospiraceae bacterium]
MKNKNLLENIEWTSWSPRKELLPEFNIENNELSIVTGDNSHVYGEFKSNMISILNLRTIIFEALVSCQNVKNKENSIFAMINFYNGQKKMLERDYADIVETDGGKAIKLYRKLDAPENAEYVMLEIGARWCPGAVVEWRDINLETAENNPPRIVKIATTYKQQRDTLEENLEGMIETINKAGESNPDVILLSELVYETCHNNNYTLDEKAQAIPGPLTDIIGEYAKKYNSYIIFTMNEKDGDIIYNTAVIIGRGGEICGKYRKTHLPLAEAEWGTSPGNELCVFDLDFGRIGIIICYDQYFPENSRTLALMGAEIIFIPTMGEDEVVQRSIARTNGVYVTVSGYTGSVSSRIINPLGEIINFVQNKDSVYATEEIDLNKRFFTYWMSIGDGNGETKVLFQKERMIDNYNNVGKDSYIVKPMV